MRLYDISMEVSQSTVTYKNNPQKKPKFKTTRTLREGANESRMDIELHTGSHVDAPYHFLQNGRTIEKIPLEKFMGKCVVLDFSNLKNSIKKTDFKNRKIKILKNYIILLKTKNRQGKKFDPNFAYLEKSGAAYLASRKIKAVGIESLGIERSQPNHETHKILLRRGIVIFEGLNLSRIRQGKYFFHGLPLKIRKGDASPVRAVLVK